MKYIKLYKDYINEGLLNTLGIRHTTEELLNTLGIQNYTINKDGIVDIEGDVKISDNLIGQKLPFWKFKVKKLPIKFGKVTGNFDCSDCYLTTLDGCPYEVGGDFRCSSNNLVNLKGSPGEVRGHYYCSNNKKLVSTEGMPLEIGGDFLCYMNKQLKRLDSMSNIEGKIYCDADLDLSGFVGYAKGLSRLSGGFQWVDAKL